MGRTAAATVVTLWAIPLSLLLNHIVPRPYMDEIFHVPQAQKYCRGDFFSWDPMITTPPGLYGLSLAYVASLFPGSWLTNSSKSLSDLCSTQILRSTNSILAVICSVIIHDLVIQIRPSISKRKATYYSILIALYPVHWFFNFLYYTDVGSLTAVLAMYLCCLKKQFWISALFGAIAVLLRQTNVIWLVFIAANGAIFYVEDLYAKEHNLKDQDGINQDISGYLKNDNKILSSSTDLRRRKRQMSSLATSTDKINGSDSISPDNSPGLVDEVFDIIKKFWWVKWTVLIAFLPYAIVLLLFLAFIVWNGGIVLGAKEAHVVSPHFAQFLYFGLVSAGALFPLHFSPSQFSKLYQLFMKNIFRNTFLVLFSLCISFIAVHYFSIAHPYLLADNRHYTFYIWRRVVQSHWSNKYILVPLYVYSWFSILTTLGKELKKIWILSFVLSVALVLVPAPLIEFRYYTIPLIILIINSPIIDYNKLLVLGFLYAFVDILTLALFLFHPFHWKHEPSTQRFLW